MAFAPRCALLAIATLLASLPGCSGNDDSPDAESTATSNLNNAPASPGFFFLQPIAAQPTPAKGTLDVSVQPVVIIEAVDPVTGAVTPYKVFKAPDVKSTGGGFHLNWDTSGVNTNRIYRVSIQVGSRCELGHQDVAFKAQYASATTFVANAGSNVPVKFWIEASDADGDGKSDTGGRCAADNCVGVANANQADTDGDHIGNACDNCVASANEDQRDTAGNGIGDACRCETVTCAASDQCRAAGVCSPTTGVCSDPAKPDGLTCTFALYPETQAFCQSGGCRRIIKEIIWSPPVDPLPRGDTGVAHAIALDSAGLPIANAPIGYSSSNTTVATIGLTTGILSGAGLGFSYLSASGDGVSAVTPIVVFDASTGFLIYGPSGGTTRAILAPNATANLVATFNVIGHLPFDATSFSAWTSSDPTVASVGVGGVVTGGLSGTATITATWGSLVATFTVISEPSGLSFTSGSGGAAAVAVGSTSTLAVTAVNAGGSAVAGLPIVFASSEPSVGTVDANTGEFHALTTGITTITASVGSVSTTLVVIVYGPDSTVSISGSGSGGTGGGGSGGSGGSGGGGAGGSGGSGSSSSAVLAIGSTFQLTATFNTIHLPISNITGYFQWVSNNPSVLWVNSSGLATAVGAGSATVTGTFGGLSVTYTFIVAGSGEEIAITIAGATSCEANDINQSGVVVGSCTVAGSNHAFYWDGTMRELAPPPGSTGNCVANAVNNPGDVVGTCGNQAALWQANGSSKLIVDTTIADGAMWNAEDINDAGIVVGSGLGYVWTGFYYGYGWGGQTVAEYDINTGKLTFDSRYNGYPMATGSALAVNQSGQAAGQFGLYRTYQLTPFYVPRGYRKTPTWEWLSAPIYYLADSLGSSCRGLNTGGVGAGSIDVDIGDFSHHVVTKAVLWAAGTSMWTLVPLPQGLNNPSVANDLNDTSVLVGEYQDTLYAKHAFMWRAGVSAVDLAPLTGGTAAGARAITNTAADGSVMVAGWSDSPGGRRAVRWRLPAP